MLVPGAGEPHYDSRVADPYAGRRAAREAEVAGLLDKLQPEMIVLDPAAIGTVRAALRCAALRCRAQLAGVAAGACLLAGRAHGGRAGAPARRPSPAGLPALVSPPGLPASTLSSCWSVPCPALPCACPAPALPQVLREPAEVQKERAAEAAAANAAKRKEQQSKGEEKSKMKVGRGGARRKGMGAGGGAGGQPGRAAIAGRRRW